MVRRSHRAVAGLAREGFHTVIIGQSHHVETLGMTGDLAEFDVILGEEDLSRMRERPRFGVIAQTTQPIGRVRHLVACLRERFQGSEVRFVDTVCQPTKRRPEVTAVPGLRHASHGFSRMHCDACHDRYLVGLAIRAAGLTGEAG